MYIVYSYDILYIMHVQCTWYPHVTVNSDLFPYVYKQYVQLICPRA